MKRCRPCGRHLRDTERACPFCGAAMPTMVMALAIAGALGCACSDNALGSADTADGGTLDAGGSETAGAGSISATSTSGAPGATGPGDGDGTTADPPPPAEEGGIGFIYGAPSDVGWTFACDLFAQDCPSGEKCMPWANDGGLAWNATRCAPVASNPGQAGEPCTVEGSAISGLDDCDLGLMCWNVDGSGEGVCEDMCVGSADDAQCDAVSDTCTIANDGALVLCLPVCDPLVQDCAGEGEACLPVNDDWVCLADASAGFGVPGDPCEYTNLCDPGNVCIAADAFSSCESPIGCCSVVCDLDSADADAECAALDPSQVCASWYIAGQAPAGHENLGVCTDPRAPSGGGSAGYGAVILWHGQ